ncbi:MAG TPA: heavy-metal-associated domain-containing protein [Burkholderiales bacterium]|jgi:copper chaperone|nr:heavy-metal-associated domain-containing protein [Burkholderiales bacterium]
METTVLKVKGMTCSGCVRSVKNVLESIQGVSAAEVSLEKAQATVTYDPVKADVNTMKEAVTDAGYKVA